MTIMDVKNAVKKYPGFSLEIDQFQLDRRSIKALVGKNGAGKTTLLKSILDQVTLEQGEIQINGQPHYRISVKNDVGFSFSDTPIFDPDFNGSEIDTIMKNIYSTWDSQLYFTNLQKMNIPLKKKVKEFSTGMKIKLNLITAIAHHPKLLVLDEVTSSLDPISRKEILSFFKAIKDTQETSILFSTHIIEDLTDIADSVSIIREGKMILEDTMSALESHYQIEPNNSGLHPVVFQNGSSESLYKRKDAVNKPATIKEIIEYCLE